MTVGLCITGRAVSPGQTYVTYSAAIVLVVMAIAATLMIAAETGTSRPGSGGAPGAGHHAIRRSVR